MKYRLFFIFLFCSRAVFAQTIQDFVEAIPKHSTVIDVPDVLNNQEEQQLQNKFEEIEESTTIEYALCIIDSLSHYPIEEIAVELGNHWGVGKKDVDNGIMILLSMKEKEIFIATGKGTEKYLPNEEVQQIIDRLIIPYFITENYYTGITKGIDEIQTRLADTPVANSQKKINMLLYLVPIILLLGVGFLFYREQRKSKKQAKQDNEEFFGGGTLRGGAGGKW